MATEPVPAGTHPNPPRVWRGKTFWLGLGSGFPQFQNMGVGRVMGILVPSPNPPCLYKITILPPFIYNVSNHITWPSHFPLHGFLTFHLELPTNSLSHFQQFPFPKSSNEYFSLTSNPNVSSSTLLIFPMFYFLICIIPSRLQLLHLLQ
jgi:hypothetical protein